MQSITNSIGARFRIPPPEVLASWPAPNYVDPVTRGYGNVYLNIVLYVFIMCFSGLRIYTRKYLVRHFGADDVFLLLALIPTTAFFIISVLAHTHFLWIRHQYDIPPDHVVTGLKMVLSEEIMFALACSLTKLSMLMLVRRMLANASSFWRRVTLFAIIVVSIQGTIFCLMTIFQCRPPQDYWKVTFDAQPNCINQGISLLIAGIVNTLTDFLVCLLPIRTVWTLQLPFRQVIAVVILFAFGFCSCLAGVVRTYYTYRVIEEYDQTWWSYPVWVTSAIELYVGVICASIPATKPFFSTYIPALFGTVSPVLSKLTDSSRIKRRSGARNLQSDSADEELISFQKALKCRGGVSNTSVASRGDQRKDEEKDDFIRITQTVEMSSG